MSEGEYDNRHASDGRFGPSRVQFIECDPDVQAYRNVTREELENKLKILALLNDVVTVPATHVLKSEKTYSVLKDNKLLLEKGIVVLSRSQAHDGFEEMLHSKLGDPEEHNPLWTPKHPNLHKQEDVLEERRRFLETHTGGVMERRITRMTGGFSSGLAQQLQDADSTLHRSIRGQLKPEQLGEKLERTDRSSRKFVFDQAGDLPNPVHRRLAHETNVNYHLTGATFHDAALSLHPYDMTQVAGRFQQAIEIRTTESGSEEIEVVLSGNRLEETGTEDVTLLRPQVPLIHDVMAFETFADIAASVTRDVAALDAEDIVDLRKEPETQYLRQELRMTANNIHGTWENDVGTVTELRRAQQAFEEALTAHYRDETARELRAERQLPTAEMGLFNGVAATLVGSFAMNDEYLGAATGVSVALLQYLLDKRTPALDLSPFVETDLRDFERTYREYQSVQA